MEAVIFRELFSLAPNFSAEELLPELSWACQGFALGIIPPLQLSKPTQDKFEG